MHKKLLIMFLILFSLALTPIRALTLRENISNSTCYRAAVATFAACTTLLLGCSISTLYKEYTHKNRFKSLSNEEFIILGAALTEKLEKDVKAIESTTTETVLTSDLLIAQYTALKKAKENILQLVSEVKRRKNDHLEASHAAELNKLKTILAKLLFLCAQIKESIDYQWQPINNGMSLGMNDENEVYIPTYQPYQPWNNTPFNSWENSQRFYFTNNHNFEIQLNNLFNHLNKPDTSISNHAEPALSLTTGATSHDILLSCYS